jgi:DNA-binding LacI/PurR family transcriptional regulator
MGAMTDSPPTRLAPRARVMRSLRQWIADGRYRCEALPSERSLAEHFQVGRGTVRSVLRDLHEQGVLDLTGYRRTVSQPGRAGGLMSRTVALITSYSSLSQSSFDPVTGSLNNISNSALHRLAECGYHALTVPLGSLDQRTIADLLANPPAGVVASDEVVTSGRGLPLIERLLEQGIPCVTFDECERLPGGVDRVLSDHSAGARMLCETLFERGFRRILRLWTSDKRDLPWVRARDEGYLQAHHAAGVPPLEAAVVHAFGHQTTEEAFDRQARQLVSQVIEHLLGEHAVDALMLMSDGSIPYAARLSELCKLRPNRELAIVGYDNFYRHVTENRFQDTPPLATIDKRNDRLGRALADMAIDRIEHAGRSEPRSRTIDVDLVIPEPALGSAESRAVH